MANTRSYRNLPTRIALPTALVASVVAALIVELIIAAIAHGAGAYSDFQPLTFGGLLGPTVLLFETLPATGITLLYRASSQADLVLTDELNTIARERQATVHYLTGHRRGGDADPLSAASLRRLLGNLREHDIYLCGPPGMTASVRRALHELGVGDTDIHEEMFTF